MLNLVFCHLCKTSNAPMESRKQRFPWTQAVARKCNRKNHQWNLSPMIHLVTWSAKIFHILFNFQISSVFNPGQHTFEKSWRDPWSEFPIFCQFFCCFFFWTDILGSFCETGVISVMYSHVGVYFSLVFVVSLSSFWIALNCPSVCFTLIQNIMSPQWWREVWNYRVSHDIQL